MKELETFYLPTVVFCLLLGSLYGLLEAENGLVCKEKMSLEVGSIQYHP